MSGRKRPKQPGAVSFAERCRQAGVDPATARNRVNRLGWSVDEALAVPTFGRAGHRERSAGGGEPVAKLPE